MPKLQDVIADPAKRKVVIADCLEIIDLEVADKGGISGLAIKAGYKVVKGVKPGFIADSVDNLLEDFCTKLQPIADEAVAANKPIADHVLANKSRLADSLLEVTDGRAKRSKHAVVKSMYEKLRPSAKKNVEDALPRVAKLIQKHTS